MVIVELKRIKMAAVVGKGARRRVRSNNWDVDGLRVGIASKDLLVKSRLFSLPLFLLYFAS